MSQPPITDPPACWNCEGFGSSHDEAETCCICNGTGTAEWEQDPLCHVHPDVRHMMETIVRLRAELKQHTGTTDTTNATTEAVRETVREILPPGVVMDCIADEITAAVLSVPRVAAGLKLLEAIEEAERKRTDWLYADELLAHLRVIAGINNTEERP